jgi:hypothetical protein
VLLGSPPDTVRGAPLRGTDSSSPLIRSRRHSRDPGAGVHPRCSGLRVQGTAISPTSAALPLAGRRPSGHRKADTGLSYIIFLYLSISTFQVFLFAEKKFSCILGKACYNNMRVCRAFVQQPAIWACSSAGSAKGSVFCLIYNFILLYSSVPLLELLIWAYSSAGSAKGSVFCHIYNFILIYSSVPLLELLIWAYSSAGRAYGSHP